ncbi:Pyruvate/Phosphoenolpyruvate kinase-like domain-containing protein [Tuber indicum]|nr:Pyruvate/Phosphoenolpyruvate kinase-like domain-containing protein [Tuber indicum]
MAELTTGQCTKPSAGVAGCGVSPIVRVAACEAWVFKHISTSQPPGALDAGAHGAMVPFVSTAEEAKAALNYANPMGAFNTSSSIEYLKSANHSILTIVQIETKQALDNVDAITGVERVDVLFVGSFDLGNSLGCPIVS